MGSFSFFRRTGREGKSELEEVEERLEGEKFEVVEMEVDGEFIAFKFKKVEDLILSDDGIDPKCDPEEEFIGDLESCLEET